MRITVDKTVEDNSDTHPEPEAFDDGMEVLKVDRKMKNIGEMLFLVGVPAALLVGALDALGLGISTMAGGLLALVWLVVGIGIGVFNISKAENVVFLIGVIALTATAALLTAVPVMGMLITGALSTMLQVMGPAAAIVGFMAIYRVVKK